MPGTADFSDKSKKLISSTTVDKGARFWEGENKDECEKGKVKCKVIYAKKGFWDDWSCEANCDCEKPEFIEKAANYCKMFGDCGADVNILGEGTDDGLEVRWTGTSKGPHPKNLPNDAYSKWNVYGVFGGMDVLRDQMNVELSNSFASFYSSTIKIFDVLHLTISAIVFGNVFAGVAMLKELFVYLGASGPWGWILVAVLFVLDFFFGEEIGKIIGDLLGYDTAEKTVIVNCEPWTAPLGGNNCERCDEDIRYDENTYANPVKCDEYRCKSLGTACEIVNAGTGNEKCVSKQPNDVMPPVINPWDEALSSGYNAQPTGTGYLIQPKLDYWKKFSFGIKTDEAAQCKWDDAHTNSYDEMAHFFGTSFTPG